jgi:hypothetical protein
VLLAHASVSQFDGGSTVQLLHRIGALALVTFALSACEDSNGPDSDARVSVVNTTNAQFDVVNDGSVAPSDSRINFAGGSQCFEVDPDAPGLSVRESNSLINISTFSPTLEPGGEHTVLIIPTTTTNVYSFIELADDFSAGSNQSGFRLVNTATGAASYDVYVTEPGAALTGARASGVTYGNASAFFAIPAGTQQQVRLTNAGTTTVAFDLGTTTFTPGQNYSLVVGMPASGSTARRTFYIVHNCL